MSKIPPDRWIQLKDLFDTAVDLDPKRRSEFLDQACGDDPSLRSQLEALIKSHEHAESFIEAPAYEVAAKLIADNQREFVEGERIGPYKIVSHIGAGGMGDVYLAQDTRLGRRVALKLLPAAFTRDEGRLRRFEQEARAASMLNHPNIITIYEVGCSQGIHFIATEFIDGLTLRQHMKVGAMTLNDGLDVSIEVARALEAAHAAGITHRDIKPENIMLRHDRYVKVLDFGLAKLSEPESGGHANIPAPVSTDPGLVMGTVGYMSPEQVRGQQVDSRTDIFSLGVVVYEMIGGHPPFEGDSAADVIASILQKDPPPPTQNIRDSNPRVDSIVSKALSKDRERRYQTVSELLVDLKSLKEEIAYTVMQATSPSGEQLGATVAATDSGSSTQRNEPASFATSGAEPIAGEFSRRTKRVAIALAGVLIAVAAIAYSFLRKSEAPISSIAVMPFVNAGADVDAEYLSDGITENIINSLSKLSALHVMARATVFRYKGRDVDPQAAGRDLKVEAVVMGKVTQRGDTLSIQAELVDVSSGRQIWGEQYTRRFSDVLLIQESISREISRKLRSTLDVADQQRIAKRYTDNAEAYQLYLKGRYHWNKRTPAGVRKAIDYFDQAVALDPSYALPYAGLADSYAMMGKEFQSQARDAANRALAMDEQLAEAHTSLGYLKMRGEWDWPGAEKELQRAIELNSNYPTAHQWYSIYLELMDHPDEAVQEAKRAQELDPLSPVMNVSLANRLYFARDYDKAGELSRSALEIDPNFAGAHAQLGEVYSQKQMYPQAIAELQRVVQLDNSPYALGVLGHTYAVSGDTLAAEKIAAGLKEKAAASGAAEGLALVHIGLGHSDEAVVWLQKAYEAHSGFLVFVKVSPVWDKLRSDPRFQDLLTRLGLAPSMVHPR